jgi:heat-inducible transcriptional repressor
MVGEGMSEREMRVLEAVIQTYVETAEPAGSQTIAQRFALGVSPATVRNTMSELEEKGFLYHPHTSAGRIPTDRAYRWYVDNLIRLEPPSVADQSRLQSELPRQKTAVEEILRRAAQVLGVLTQELGVAVVPALDAVVLERLDLVPVSSERLLLVFHLRSGVVRTIFVQIRGHLAPDVIQRVATTLNERLGGLSLATIRTTLTDRLRDSGKDGKERDLLNIFIAEGEDLFSLQAAAEPLVLGSAQMLADQPEFTRDGRMRDLLDLTERRDVLQQALATRRGQGLTITIGDEHADARLNGFTLVTSSYHRGDLSGVIGVIGPTRMPYEKIVGLVQHTSRMVEGLLE